jgi:hypothetical protein
MNLIKRLFGLDNGSFSKEYFEKFINPAMERAKAAGMPQEALDKAWERSMSEATPQLGGPYPGALFQQSIDEWIASHDA